MRPVQGDNCWVDAVNCKDVSGQGNVEPNSVIDNV